MEGMGKRKQTRHLSVALIVCCVQFLTGHYAPFHSRWETQRERERGRKTRNENRREDLYQNPTVRILHHCHSNWVPGNGIHNGAVTLATAW